MHELAHIVGLPKDPAAPPKVDRLATYNSHRICWWGSTVDLLAWRAAGIADMSPDEQTLHLRRQMVGVIGSQELA
jgi:hypothetical protein